MPIGRAWSYRHCILRSYDQETYYSTNDDDRKDIMEEFQSLLKK